MRFGGFFMPSEIKKFNLTYAQVPDVFGLDENFFLTKIADTIPDQIWKQTSAQKKQVKQTVDQLEKDVTRASYVDIEGSRVSQLKTQRLITKPNGALTLAPGVYPDFSQGGDTGRCVGEMLYLKPLIEFQGENPTTDEQNLIRAERILVGFNYINKQGQLAGLSLQVILDGEYKGWILSTIQNTTARPEDRTVTVLSTPKYITSEAQSTVSMDNLNVFEQELKAAICHDKIADLVKGIFNADGSLNATYLAELTSRLPENANLDDRDRKSAQLHALFSLAETRHDATLDAYTASMKQTIADDINFFKAGVFVHHLNKLIHKLTLSKTQRVPLEKASKLYADLEILAEENLFDTAKSYTYKKIAEHIKSDIKLFWFWRVFFNRSKPSKE